MTQYAAALVKISTSTSAKNSTSHRAPRQMDLDHHRLPDAGEPAEDASPFQIGPLLLLL